MTLEECKNKAFEFIKNHNNQGRRCFYLIGRNTLPRYWLEITSYDDIKCHEWIYNKYFKQFHKNRPIGIQGTPDDYLYEFYSLLVNSDKWYSGFFGNSNALFMDNDNFINRTYDDNDVYSESERDTFKLRFDSLSHIHEVNQIPCFLM